MDLRRYRNLHANPLITLRRLHSLAFGFGTFAYGKTELPRLTTVCSGDPDTAIEKSGFIGFGLESTYFTNGLAQFMHFVRERLILILLIDHDVLADRCVLICLKISSIILDVRRISL